MAALSGEPFQRYVSLPAGEEVPLQVQAVTGLSTELVNRQGEPFAEAYTAFRAYLQRQVDAAGPDAYLLLVGHNVKSELLLRRRRSTSSAPVAVCLARVAQPRPPQPPRVQRLTCHDSTARPPSTACPSCARPVCSIPTTWLRRCSPAPSAARASRPA